MARPPAEPYELPVSGSLALARWGTLLTGVAACISAVVGLAYGSQWLYQSDGLTLGQIYGHDLVVLLVALPVLALSVRRALQGSARALITWAGALMYLAYWYHFLLGGIEFGAAYIAHLALVGGSLFSLAVLAARLDVERFAHRVSEGLPARALGGLMAVTGSWFAAVGLFDIVERLRHAEILDPAVRGIYTVDLTIMLPATLVAGALLWRRQTWGYVLAGPLFVNATLSAGTLFAAAVAVRAAIPVPAILIGGVGIATLILAGASLVFLRGVRE